MYVYQNQTLSATDLSNILYYTFISCSFNYGSEIYMKTNKRHMQALAVNTEQIIKNPAI